MREILFRGKRLNTGEWVYGDVQHDYDGSPRCISDYCGANPVDPDTVGQYTGLNDKNGQRIFEGDIVRIERAEWCFDGMSTDYRTELGVIAYDDWGMIGLIVDRWEGRPVWSDFFHVCGLTDRVHDWSYEVIGNIHDNPELAQEVQA